MSNFRIGDWVQTPQGVGVVVGRCALPGTIPMVKIFLNSGLLKYFYLEEVVLLARARESRLRPESGDITFGPNTLDAVGPPPPSCQCRSLLYGHEHGCGYVAGRAE